MSAVTIHQIAEARVGKSGTLTGADYIEAQLPMLGGCECCHASIAGYNAYPAQSGFIRCADCIGDDGYPTLVAAIAAIFGGES